MQAKNASCGPLFSALLGFCVGLDAKKDLRGWRDPLDGKKARGFPLALDGKTLSTARKPRERTRADNKKEKKKASGEEPDTKHEKAGLSLGVKA
jgi:hypothetical protein